MDAIRLRNLRSLTDTGFIEIRPLTLLVGRNSSGKSTFLRLFPLLRQSVETRTTGPILWYGNYVDFGSFEDAVRVGADPSEIGIDFRFSVRAGTEGPLRPFRWSRTGARARLLGDVVFNLGVTLAPESRDGESRCVAINLSFSGHNVGILIEPNGTISKLDVNSLNVLGLDAIYTTAPTTGFLPPLVEKTLGIENLDRTAAHGEFSDHSRISSALFSEFRLLFHGNTKPETIRSLIDHVGIGSDQQILESLRGFRQGGDYWRKRAAGLRVGSARLTRIRDLLIANSVPEIIDLADVLITKFASSVKYIGPFRATAERYYRTQGLAVEEVDFEGRNLAMFLRSLTDTERRNFQEWMSRRFGLSVTTRLAGGHLSVRVVDQSSNELNLADVGFGFSQVLPVLAQLWALMYRNTKRVLRRSTSYLLAIEQPELHLHPSLQARLADVLLESVLVARRQGVDFRLVIETHSETIINRIGNTIYKRNEAAPLVSVLVFEGKASTSSSVRVAEYDKEGFLRNWPLGFFEPESNEAYAH